MEETCKIVQEELANAHRKQKSDYNRRNRTKLRKFLAGEFVLLLLPTDANKLLMQWKGPCEIVGEVRLNDYKINVNGKMKILHANLLKKYHVRNHDTDHSNHDHRANVSASSAQQATMNELDDDEQLEFSNFESRESVATVKIGNLSDSELLQTKALLNEYRDVFNEVPGCTNIIEHKIVLTSDKPVRSKPYAVPFSMRDSPKCDIEAMIENKIIRPSTSPYASPIVLVKKKDGTNRICVDYRKLNKLTIFDPEPMPTAVDVFEKLANDRYFTTIDFTKGYWQIPVADADIHKTAFVTHDGTFEFVKMPFGMINSSAIFVCAMRKLLHGIDNVKTYIDDVIVHTREWNEHLNTLKCLFERFRDADMTVKPSKCVIGARKVDFLGPNVGDGMVGLHNDNVEKIKYADRPQTKRDVRSFLGLTGYYCDYIPHYAAIAAPLTDLTKKGCPRIVQWGVVHENAFKALNLV